MRRASHIQLGRLLSDACLAASPRRCVFAFKFGCIQPDINPATYVKGSRRAETLRGHNFVNAENYIRRSASRLERRGLRGIFSFYRMGKLVHYISDGFTRPHNEDFAGGLREHTEYEAGLNLFFLGYLRANGLPRDISAPARSAFGIISREHREYMERPASFETDTEFAIETALRIVALFTGGGGEPSFA